MDDQRTVTIHPYGPEAWLVEHHDPLAWTQGLRDADLPGVLDVVPAETTVLVACERRHRAAVGEALAGIASAAADEHADDVSIPVTYDGDDLEVVASAVGLTIDEVIAVHCGATYTVAFCGFSPGFAYLRGLDGRLHIGRRDTPRTLVPAGSVAIAAHYTAVYPRATPGGWHLLGHTDVEVWNLDRSSPALLTPGCRVRFERV